MVLDGCSASSVPGGRIVFLSHYGTSIYGANRSLLELMDGLGPLGWRSHVICRTEGPFTAELERRGIPWVVVPMPQWLSKERTARMVCRRMYDTLACMPRLMRQLRTWRIDIVYTNSSVLAVGAALAALTRHPHVWHIREFGNSDYGMRCDYGDAAFRRIVGHADAVILISHALQRAVFGDMLRDNVHMVYNGIATRAKFDDLRSRSINVSERNRPYTFAMVGLIHPAKGQETAIRALGILRGHTAKVQLRLVGMAKPDYLQRCKALTHECGVAEQVVFVGHVNNPWEEFIAADATLMCSRSEAFGRVTVESMASCRPVIGYASGGTVELIKNGKTGLLYHNGPEELAEAMLRLIESPEYARQLAEQAWVVARESFCTEVYAQRISAILSSVLGH